MLNILCILLLLCCGVGVALAKKLLTAILLYGGFGLTMTLVWLMVQAPDLAMTEAAVGVGVTSLLYFTVLQRLGKQKDVS